MLGSAGANRGALPGARRRGRALRELLHQGHPARGRPGGLDPPHGPQAARGEPRAARSGSPSSTPTRPGPRATKVTVAGRRGLGAAGRLHRGRAARCSSPGVARGEASTPELDASWDLRFDPGRRAFHHLPYAFLYGAPLPKTKLLSPYPDARFTRLGDGRRRAARARRVAGDDRPQLGFRARRALDLDPGERVPRGRRLLRRRARPDQDRAADHALGRQRDAAPRRRGAPARRPRPDPLDPDRRRADRVRVRAHRQGRQGTRPRRLRAAQLRRLGLRRPGRPRAQHPQLLDLRPRAHGRAQGPSAAAARVRRAPPPTRSACGRPTTASRCSRTPTASVARAQETSTTSSRFAPRGVSSDTCSPARWPSRALPIGLSTESLPSARSASSGCTRVTSESLPASSR